MPLGQESGRRAGTWKDETAADVEGMVESARGWLQKVLGEYPDLLEKPCRETYSRGGSILPDPPPRPRAIRTGGKELTMAKDGLTPLHTAAKRLADSHAHRTTCMA